MAAIPPDGPTVPPKAPTLGPSPSPDAVPAANNSLPGNNNWASLPPDALIALRSHLDEGKVALLGYKSWRRVSGPILFSDVISCTPPESCPPSAGDWSTLPKHVLQRINSQAFSAAHPTTPMPFAPSCQESDDDDEPVLTMLRHAGACKSWAHATDSTVSSLQDVEFNVLEPTLSESSDEWFLAFFKRCGVLDRIHLEACHRVQLPTLRAIMGLHSLQAVRYMELIDLRLEGELDFSPARMLVSLSIANCKSGSVALSVVARNNHLRYLLIRGARRESEEDSQCTRIGRVVFRCWGLEQLCLERLHQIDELVIEAPTPSLKVLKFEELNKTPRLDFESAIRKMSSAELKQILQLSCINCKLVTTAVMKQLMQSVDSSRLQNARFEGSSCMDGAPARGSSQQCIYDQRSQLQQAVTRVGTLVLAGADSECAPEQPVGALAETALAAKGVAQSRMVRLQAVKKMVDRRRRDQQGKRQSTLPSPRSNMLTSSCWIHLMNSCANYEATTRVTSAPVNATVESKGGGKASTQNNPTRQTQAGSHKTKTEICSMWLKRGSCDLAANCPLAHGTDELRRPGKAELRKSRFKSQLCRAFTVSGRCNKKNCK